MFGYTNAAYNTWLSSLGRTECDKIKTVIIENGITNIGRRAFSGLTSLESIKIPATVTEIGDSAFWYCQSLRFISLPEGVTTIGTGTFYNGLTTIVLPKSIKKIGIQSNVDNLWDIYYRGTKSQWDQIEFVDLGVHPFQSASIHYGYVPKWTSATYSWADDNSTVTATRSDLTIPINIETEVVNTTSKVTTAPQCENTGILSYTTNSFRNPAFSVQIKRVPIPATGHSVIIDPMKEPTYLETGLTEGKHCKVCGKVIIAQEEIPAKASNILYLPASVQSIEDEAFRGSSFDAIVIPSNCKSVGQFAFADCLNLKYVKIQSNNIQIAENAFDGCLEILIER